MKSKLITTWAPPDELIETAAGMVTYRALCEKEQRRLKGQKTTIVTRKKDGWNALSR